MVEKINCEYCNKKFIHVNNYYRHRKHRCKKNPKFNSATIINNYNIQNIQNNITINNFGEENIDYITDEILLKIMDHPYNAIQKTSEEIHFNPNHPENNNIQTTAISSKHIDVLVNGKWGTVVKKLVCNKMKRIAMFILNDVYLREGPHKMSDECCKEFEQFRENMKIKKDINKFIQDSLELLLKNGSVISI